MSQFWAWLIAFIDWLRHRKRIQVPGSISARQS